VRDRTFHHAAVSRPDLRVEYQPSRSLWGLPEEPCFRQVGNTQRLAPQSTKAAASSKAQKVVLLDAPTGLSEIVRKNGGEMTFAVQNGARTSFFGKHSSNKDYPGWKLKHNVCRSCDVSTSERLALHCRYWGWTILALFIFIAQLGFCIPHLQCNTYQQLVWRRFTRRSLKRIKDSGVSSLTTTTPDTKAEILNRIVRWKLIHGRRDQCQHQWTVLLPVGIN